jgi:hypothetical protein
MTNAPEKIWVHFSDFDEHDVCTSYPVENAGEYTRTDISQARIAELEAALQGMIDFYVEIDSAGGAPGDADISAMEPSVVVARAALKAKP